MLLAELRVLTTWQIAALEFTSPISARHRMKVLVGLKVLDCFQPRRELGSAPMHYVLAPLGAAVVAAEDPDRTPEEVAKILRRARSDQALALVSEPKLAHSLGVNDFYCALHARASRLNVVGEGLVAWQGERTLRDLGDLYRSFRPDSWGWWREGGGQTAFFLEYDRGTEQLKRLSEKLSEYRFFQSLRDDHWRQQHGDQDETVPWPEPWVLFCFLSEQRERNARTHLRPAALAAGLSVATGVLAPGADPGEAVWLPVAAAGISGGTPARFTLAGLPPARSAYTVDRRSRVPVEPEGFDDDR
ncbi:replication-relaxation family protein [Streptacidiphilus carbonis]|uniref:replication-relaxation family protein n=1 Tax=Streptacidiphilus carbonis TaxID=105422 RepID=UPI000693DA26|nr:replication-relaxation family protein [Streptacidiphilus carbonis]